MIVSIIAAMAKGSRGIGLRGDLPWRLPADMARFRKLTMGHVVIMGRTTWTPIAERGLPGRRVIVLSRRRSQQDTVEAVAGSLQEAIQMAAEIESEGEVFIAGGAQVYEQALADDLVDRMYLTIVHGEVEADTFFPEYDESEWRTILKEEHPPDERNPYRMTFYHVQRTLS